jgi:hypothetical protein
MDCRSVRELADSFLSEQLLVETNHEVLRHLETCAACRAELAARGAIRDRLREAFGSAVDLKMRPEFAAELANTLRSSMRGRSPDSDRPLYATPDDPGLRVSRRSVLRSWWTAAAGVVLAAGGGAVLVRQARSRSRLAELARVAAADHQNCAITFHLTERPIPLDEAGRRYGMPYGQMTSFEIPAVTPPAQDLERHSCVYDGQRFAHVVMRYRGAVTSLLVTHGSGPSDPQLESSVAAPVVASFAAGEFVAFIVSDLAGDDVLQLARAIAPPLERHLSA